MKTIILAILLMANLAYADGLSGYIGGAISANEDNRFNNPIGIVGMEYAYQSNAVYIEHISSIPNRHDYGLNLLGVKHDFKVADVVLSIGLTTHDKTIDDSNDYGGQVNSVIPRLTASYKLLFIEMLGDNVLAGVKVKFGGVE